MGQPDFGILLYTNTFWDLLTVFRSGLRTDISPSSVTEVLELPALHRISSVGDYYSAHSKTTAEILEIIRHILGQSWIQDGLLFLG